MECHGMNDSIHSLPLSQIALSTIDLRRSDAFWREALGFLPSATSRMFRGGTISNVMHVEDAKTTTRWLVGQDEWLQIEIWQFENPVPRLMDQGFAPNYAGYSRCGVWVKEFEETLNKLSQMGYPPLAAPTGGSGERRVCVRDPDGIYVELFERDPLEGQVPPAAYACNAALRSITLTTEDFASSCRFVESGLGLVSAGSELHGDEHEALWNLDNVVCERKTYLSGKMLLEVVHYATPATQARHPHSRLIDQGILNIAFGDSKSVHGIRRLEDQTIRCGAAPTERMVTPLGGCVYVTDAQGFSFELTWASRFLAQRVAGYFPMKSRRFLTADNKEFNCEVAIDAPADQIWPFLTDPSLMNEWCTVGNISLLKTGCEDEFGVGCQRKVVRGRHEMVEEITHYSPCKELRYRLLRRGPFVNMCGEINLEEVGDCTTVSWRVRFRSRLPLLGWLLKISLLPKYRRALTQLKYRVL